MKQQHVTLQSQVKVQGLTPSVPTPNQRVPSSTASLSMASQGSKTTTFSSTSSQRVAPLTRKQPPLEFETKKS